MLLSSIDKDLFDKLSIAKGLIDQLKVFVNPELFMKLQDNKNKKDDSFIRKNSDFERVSQVGIATGKMKPSKITQYVIDKMNERKKQKNKKLYLKKDKHLNEDNIIG